MDAIIIFSMTMVLLLLYCTSGDCNFPKSKLPVSMHAGQNTDYEVAKLAENGLFQPHECSDETIAVSVSKILIHKNP